MRIFETFTYNLNKIKFKENYGFLTSLLAENGFSYPDLGFCFTHGNTAVEKIKSKFPSLNRYCSKDAFSSISQDGAKYIADEDKSAFLSLLQKVPHTYNFGFMTVTLDNIDWYGRGAGKGVNFIDVDKNTRDIFDARYYGNYVKFKKQFDYGNKYNFVIFCIERFGDDKELEPLPPAFEAVISALGKPYHRELQCVDEKEERERCTSEASKIRARFSRDMFSERFKDFEHTTPLRERTFESAVDDITPTKGISPKKAIAAPAKKHGYKFFSYGSGEYEYRKTNRNNHIFVVRFVVPPFTPFLFSDIEVFGYNFKVLLPGGDQIKPRTDDKITEYADICFSAAEELEAMLTDELLTSFGRTPDWYNRVGG